MQKLTDLPKIINKHPFQVAYILLIGLGLFLTVGVSTKTFGAFLLLVCVVVGLTWIAAWFTDPDK
jgi:uncharacterized membrane protein YphA (DoxX/SURF4 family)